MSTPIRLGAVLAVLALSIVARGQFVKLEGRKFMLNGEEFYPIAVNFGITFSNDDLNDAAAMYPVPHRSYGPSVGPDIECDSPENCNERLRFHLQKVKDMGFNSIRLLAGITMGVGADGWYLRITQNLPEGDGYEPTYKARLSEPDFQDDASLAYFNAIRTTLDIANDLGLKVFLLAADNDDANYYPVSTQADVDRYGYFLTRLAEELRDHEALLAYDLWNEPRWTSPSGDLKQGFNARQKREVCHITAQWYNDLHDADPNHYVTLGSAGFDDLYSWAPNNIWLDFVSLHHYPSFSRHEDNTDMTAMTERYNNQLYWHAMASPMPYIIGEISFSADSATDDHFDDAGNNHLDGDPAHHRMPWMHGSEPQQAGFAEQTLFSVRRNWGSGYSWWDFQNHRGSNLAGRPKDYLGNFSGLLKYGNPNASPPIPWEDKLLVAGFMNHTTVPFFNDPPEQPLLYTQSHFPPGTPLLKTVSVVNYHTGAPIKNAIAHITAHIHHPYTAAGYEYDTGTQLATTADGLLHLPMVPDLPPHHIVESYRVDILAPGCNPRSYSGEMPPNLFGSTVLVHNIPDAVGVPNPRFNYSDHWLNETIALGEERDLRAWNDMKVEQTVYAGNTNDGGQGSLRARESIQLLDGFHVQHGAEVHIKPGETFPDCDALDPVDMQPDHDDLGGSPKSRATKTEGFDLVFHRAPVEQALVYPNPTADLLTIQTTFESGRFTIADMTGTSIVTGVIRAQRTVVDVSKLAAGSYTVLIDAAHGMLGRRFTKVH